MSDQNNSFLEDKDFSSLVKKARRASIIRNTLISIIVCVVLFSMLYLVGRVVMQKKIDAEGKEDGIWQQMIGANVGHASTLYHYSSFSATATTSFTKYVRGVPVPWGSEEKIFTIFGTTRSIVTATASGFGSIDDKRIPLYFQGERLTGFFHPNVDYEHVFDDRPLLNEIDESKVVELAFSFDKPYSVQEVQEVFSNHLAWYWVDTFSPTELAKSGSNTVSTPITGDNAIGFQHSDYPDVDPPLLFMTAVEWLMENGEVYRDDAQQIYDNITNDQPESFTPSNLRILGVVVTGSPEELKAYNDIPHIRAAILGATVDKY